MGRQRSSVRPARSRRPARARANLCGWALKPGDTYDALGHLSHVGLMPSATNIDYIVDSENRRASHRDRGGAFGPLVAAQ